MSISLDLTYPNLLNVVGHYLRGERTESRAFLGWFLEQYYRLDDTDAQDAICDGPDDKGVDGIYVDENLETIDILQCKIMQNPAKTLGDVALKELAGALTQFANAESVDELATTTRNAELSKLIVAENIATKIRDGYTVRGVFVTNGQRDDNAIGYLALNAQIRLWDLAELSQAYVPVHAAEPIRGPIVFDTVGYDCATYNIGDVVIVVAPLKALDLVKLQGIASQELFAGNVRGALGKTKVNKDIARSIEDSLEHANFLLYHNGLTMLCQELTIDTETLTVDGYSVVNGCQSLTSLYDGRSKLTDSLRLLTRLIKLPGGHPLVEKITHHSNNQNPINARDLQSNSAIQRRLQNEFSAKYPGAIFYQIKRGETPSAPMVIENDEAGRLLLAYDLKEPWTCHQSYKVLDDLHAQIFARPEVNADRIVAVSDIDEEVKSCMDLVDDKLLANYRLTRYFLLYLVRRALEMDDLGASFCADPSSLMKQPNGREHIRKCINRVVRDLIIDVNAEVRERNGGDSTFDYKRELKSPTAVRELEKQIIPTYQKAVDRDRATSFAQEWATATE